MYCGLTVRQPEPIIKDFLNYWWYHRNFSGPTDKNGHFHIKNGHIHIIRKSHHVIIEYLRLKYRFSHRKFFWSKIFVLNLTLTLFYIYYSIRKIKYY